MPPKTLKILQREDVLELLKQYAVGQPNQASRLTAKTIVILERVANEYMIRLSENVVRKKNDDAKVAQKGGVDMLDGEYEGKGEVDVDVGGSGGVSTSSAAAPKNGVFSVTATDVRSALNEMGLVVVEEEKVKVKAKVDVEKKKSARKKKAAPDDTDDTSTTSSTKKKKPKNKKFTKAEEDEMLKEQELLFGSAATLHPGSTDLPSFQIVEEG
ncbi:hypothetical protein ScalyP_jg5442 [Parmales sp. scaly parma]|nr:hypothetical protein ScalyP_jg5442 [Parmales sp. scaly parma]